MRITPWIATGLLSAIVLSGCKTVPYDPATNNDTTPPVVGIRVTGDSPTSDWDAASGQFTKKIALSPVDVGVIGSGTPSKVPVQVHEHGEASVVATAQDDESGIRSLKLTCQRQVYYNWDAANQTESNAILAPVTTAQDNQPNNGQVPLSGIQQQVLNMWGQMSFPTSQGTMRRAHRVGATCSAEASNFSGQTVYSRAVLVWAQDHAVQP